MCLSADMVPQSFIDDIRSPGNAEDGRPAVAVSKIAPEKQAELIAKLQQAVADNEECPVSCHPLFHRLMASKLTSQICCDELEPPNKPCITDCGHPACLPCLSAWLVKSSSCPQCRHTITPSSLLELPPPVVDVDDEDGDTRGAGKNGKRRIKSAKIDELVKYLKAFAPDEKTLVFSQFTTFLDCVVGRLEEEGLGAVRFDGSMSAKKVRRWLFTSAAQSGLKCQRIK